MIVMKKLLFVGCMTVLHVISVNAQESNKACYQDTGFVEMAIYKTDTFYQLKEKYRKGDWNLYYDFTLVKPYAEQHFDNYGNRKGVWKMWHSNGTMQSEYTYEGSWLEAFPVGKSWSAEGKVTAENKQANDSVYVTNYYASGKKKNENVYHKAGKLGTITQWCDNGQVMVSYRPTSEQTLPVKKYYCDGKLKAEYNWYVFGFTGKYVEYHPNGKVAVSGTYQDIPAGGKPVIPARNGEWKFFDDKGKMTRQEKWDNGKLVSKK
jgi:antitoxin component YwqK of YwqJK toxin-antitoxin module